jgi:hypothetical protein
MYDTYPVRLSEASAYDAWQKGPVTFEPPRYNVHLEDYVPSGWI